MTKENYIKQFEKRILKQRQVSQKIKNYLYSQFLQLNRLVDGISKDNFWECSPVILGIDAKLLLLTELMSFEGFSDDEIIRIVEHDYRNYFKELCGYDLSKEIKESLVFNVI